MIPWRATTPRGRWILCLGLVMAVAGALLRYPVVAGIGVVLVVLVTVEVAAVLRRPDVGVHRTVEPLVVVRQQACAGHLRLKGGRTGLVRHLAQVLDEATATEPTATAATTRPPTPPAKGPVAP